MDLFRKYPTSGQAAARSNAARALYCEKLGKLWKHATPVCEIPLRGEQNLYWMLLATDHPAAQRIAEGVMKRRDKAAEQGSLF